MYRHASSGALLYDVARLHPDDADRLRRWIEHGRPAIPLLTDAKGDVLASTHNLPAVLASAAPRWGLFRHAATSWVDQHCR